MGWPTHRYRQCSISLLLAGVLGSLQASEWLRLLKTMRLDGALAGLVRTHIPAHLVEEFLRSGYRYEVSKRSGTQ